MFFFLAITFSYLDPLEGDKSHQFPFTKILSLNNNKLPSLGCIILSEEDIDTETIRAKIASSCNSIDSTEQESCRLFSDQLLEGAIFVANNNFFQLMKEFPPVDYLYIDVPKGSRWTIVLSDLPSTMNVIIGSYLSTIDEQSSSRRLERIEKDEPFVGPARILLYAETEKVPFLILVDQSVEFATTCTCDNLYLVHTSLRHDIVSPARLQNKNLIGSSIQIDYLMNQFLEVNSVKFFVDQISFIFDEQIPDFTFTYTKDAFCISYGGGPDSNEGETSGEQSDSVCPENAYHLPYKHAKSFGLIYNADAPVTIKFAKGTDVESTTELPSLNLTLGNTVFGDNIYHNWLSPSSIDTTTSSGLSVTFQEEGWASTDKLPSITYSVSPKSEVITEGIQHLSNNLQSHDRYTPTFTMPLSIPYKFNFDFNYYTEISVKFIYQKNGIEEYDEREIFPSADSGIFLVNNDNEKIFAELGISNQMCFYMESVRFEINKESPNFEVNENQLPDTCIRDDSLLENVLSHFNEEEKKEIINGKLPSIGILMVSVRLDDEDKDDFKETIANLCSYQKGEYLTLCQKLQESVKQSDIVDSYSLNNYLKTVSKDLDVLYLDGILNHPDKIDLNNLPSPMTVVIGFPIEDKSSSVLNLYSHLIRHIKKKIQNRKSIKQVTSQNTISLVGGINSKVPFLIIRDWRVKFVDSDCNSDNLLLQRTMIVKGSTKLANNHLIVDMNQMQSLYKRVSNEYIELSVKQPTIYSSQQIGNFIIQELTIEYQDSQWKITTGPTDITNGQSFLPYSVAKEKLGFILNLRRSLIININCQNQTLDEYLPINLTVGRTVMGDTYVDSFWEFLRAGPNVEEDSKTLNNGAKLLASEDITVTVKATGWGDKKPESINIIYSKGVTVNTNEIQDLGIPVKEEEQKLPTFKTPSDDDKGLPTEAIIGIVIAVVVVVGVVVGVLVYFFVCRKKSESKSENQAEAL